MPLVGPADWLSPPGSRGPGGNGGMDPREVSAALVAWSHSVEDRREGRICSDSQVTGCMGAGE